jgi:ribosomal protein L11 methyltransferase
MTSLASHPDTQVARITVDRASADRIADALTEALDPETCAVSLFESGSDWTVETSFHNDADRALISEIVAQIAGDAARDLAFTTIGTRDWVAASLQELAPVHAGRIVVHGAHDRAHVRPNQIGIEIEAALAFGTGHHGTTRGCLVAFEGLRKSARPGRRWRILDVGTGTGVLAIAAARALRVPVLATDIDPKAIAVARENAQANQCGALLQTITAAGVDMGRIRARRYDLIFANILEAPLRRMSAPLSSLLAANGQLILSGLLAAQAPSVIAAYRRQGLRLEKRLTLDGWATLVMRR